VLQRRHIIAGSFNYCGKEFKRKLEQGPVDHEIDYRCKVYENGRVAADPETLRRLTGFSEREIANGTRLHRKPIRLFRHGGTVTRTTYKRIITFLTETRVRLNECNGDLSSVVLGRSFWVGSHVELMLVFVGDPKSALLIKIASGIYLYNRQRHGL
jgi:hypothetical protein